MRYLYEKLVGYSPSRMLSLGGLFFGSMEKRNRTNCFVEALICDKFASLILKFISITFACVVLCVHFFYTVSFISNPKVMMISGLTHNGGSIGLAGGFFFCILSGSLPINVNEYCPASPRKGSSNKRNNVTCFAVLN